MTRRCCAGPIRLSRNGAARAICTVAHQINRKRPSVRDFLCVSNNTGRYWDISNAQELLDVLEDNAAEFLILEALKRSCFYGLMRFLKLFILSMAIVNLAAATPEKMLVFIGTYTGGPSKGIYSCELNMKDGSLRPIDVGSRDAQAHRFSRSIRLNSFFTQSTRWTATKAKKPGQWLASGSMPPAGKLTRINDTSTGGPGPCHLSLDKSGKFALVANYGGGSVCAVPINAKGEVGEATAFIQHTGSSVNKRRQSEPHAHSINLDAQNRFAIAADLGLDKLLVYRFDADAGTLTPNSPPFAALAPGSGPRHFAFHPNGKNAYVINEILRTITALSYQPDSGVPERVADPQHTSQRSRAGKQHRRGAGASFREIRLRLKSRP